MKWINMHSREVPFYENLLAATNYNQAIRKTFGFYYKRFAFYGEKNIVDSFIGQREKQRILDTLKQRILRDKNFFKKLDITFKQEINILKTYTKLLKSKDIHKLSNKELSDFFQKLLKLHNKGFTALRIPLLMEDLIDELPKYKKEIIAAGVKRNKLGEAIYETLYLTRDKLMIEIIERMKIPTKYKGSLLPKEIINFLENNRKPNLNKLQARYENYIIVLNPEGIKILEGEKAKKYRKDMEVVNMTINKNAKVFKGKPASGGYAKAKVKVIKTTADAQKAPAEIIAVCQFTSMEFAPYFPKFKAVVTEDSGLLNHAAVTSREMKIPCVVGIKMATKIFKDEDLIEVDANKGMVKILKRKKYEND